MVGKIDLLEFCLFCKYFFRALAHLVKKPRLIYLTISQTKIGFLRDILFILASKIISPSSQVTVHLHGSNFRNMYNHCSPTYKKLLTFALGQIDSAIVLGERLKGIFDGLIEEDRIFVVPNGISDPYLESVRAQTASKHFRVIYLGNMVKGKGYLQLLQAAQIVLTSCESVNFRFVGEWLSKSDREYAEQFLTENKMTNRVRFEGKAIGRHKYHLLRSSDLFVFPSQWNEGQPLVILEAMACGLPILTTNRGAIPETVRCGVNGFILDDGSAKNIANKIIFLARHKELCKTMGRKSREIYEVNYTIDKFIANLQLVWLKTLLLRPSNMRNRKCHG